DADGTLARTRKRRAGPVDEEVDAAIHDLARDRLEAQTGGECRQFGALAPRRFLQAGIAFRIHSALLAVLRRRPWLRRVRNGWDGRRATAPSARSPAACRVRRSG